MNELDDLSDDGFMPESEYTMDGDDTTPSLDEPFRSMLPPTVHTPLGLEVVMNEAFEEDTVVMTKKELKRLLKEVHVRDTMPPPPGV